MESLKIYRRESTAWGCGYKCLFASNRTALQEHLCFNWTNWTNSRRFMPILSHGLKAHEICLKTRALTGHCSCRLHISPLMITAVGSTKDEENGAGYVYGYGTLMPSLFTSVVSSIGFLLYGWWECKAGFLLLCSMLYVATLTASLSETFSEALRAHPIILNYPSRLRRRQGL